jgi:hypothetical protein
MTNETPYTRQTYSGKCKGGPWDGKMLAHYSATKEFFSPMSAGIFPHENTPVIPVKIGEYYWAAHNYWQWAPTKEGKALKTLQRLDS